MAESYHVYILQDAAGSYYVGYASDVAARVLAHKNGRGGLYTKKLISPKIVYSELQPTLAAAMKRELQIKGWSRTKKQALIESRWADLKKLGRRQS